MEKKTTSRNNMNKYYFQNVPQTVILLLPNRRRAQTPADRQQAVRSQRRPKTKPFFLLNITCADAKSLPAPL